MALDGRSADGRFGLGARLLFVEELGHFEGVVSFRDLSTVVLEYFVIDCVHVEVVCVGVRCSFGTEHDGRLNLKHRLLRLLDLHRHQIRIFRRL